MSGPSTPIVMFDRMTGQPPAATGADVLPRAKL